MSNDPGLDIWKLMTTISPVAKVVSLPLMLKLLTPRTTVWLSPVLLPIVALVLPLESAWQM
jgi:hypothetical protein